MRHAMNQPTAYPELNGVLHDFVTSVQEILGENFIAAYLVGSHATGDWDAHGDVDFVVVIERDLNDAEQMALNAMHARIHDGGTYWHTHLEGSYFPKAIIRQHDPNHTALCYLDNGQRSLERSTHCNELVVRWVVRERGIVLAGQEPSALIDPIPLDAMEREVRETMRAWGAEIVTGEYQIDNTWAWSFATLMYCRMLHTLYVGRIESKQMGARFGKIHLAKRWHALIDRALAQRDGQFLAIKSADPNDVTETVAFVRYVLDFAGIDVPESSEKRTEKSVVQ